jgi:N-formylglutamate amidohydrolase
MHSHPVVFHIPHSSVNIPFEYRDAFLISGSDLDEELLRLTDHYTDELFFVPDITDERIIFPVSRLLIDPERFLEDSREPMARKGMGVIYEKTAELEPLRRNLGARKREHLIQRYYLPHHERLSNSVDKALSRFGRCLIIDCHSYPEKPLPYEDDQNPDRPDICIGKDEFHTPEWLAKSAIKIFESEGFCTSVNRPFSGALVPLNHYKESQSVASIMIEINRKRYMDETTGEKLGGFSDSIPPACRRGPEIPPSGAAGKFIFTQSQFFDRLTSIMDLVII